VDALCTMYVECYLCHLRLINTHISRNFVLCPSGAHKPCQVHGHVLRESIHEYAMISYEVLSGRLGKNRLQNCRGLANTQGMRA
jgi:hypothetical protein